MNSLRNFMLPGLCSLALYLSGGTACAAEGTGDDPVYLFSYFMKNGEDGLHLASSQDGLQWKSLNEGKPFLKPEVGGKLMRDPCIIRGPQGKFHMVWTTSWKDKGIGLAHSDDLVNWSPQQFVPVMEHEPAARNCWAPEITWDPEGGQYVIYWATTIPGRFPDTEGAGDKGLNHRMYFTTTRDFKDFSDTKLFYDPGFNVIDSTIRKAAGRYVMILKDETLEPPAKCLKVAFSERVTGPWGPAGDSFTDTIRGWKEGPTLFQVDDWWVVYFDVYNRHHFGAMRTRDFEVWQDISERISYPKGMRHGTVLRVNREILDGILKP